MTNILIKNGRIIDPANNTDKIADLYISGGKIAAAATDCEIIDAAGCWVVPGLIDLHVHFRDPGQTHKEDLASGAAAAALGGFTTVCTMPNTSPVVDSAELIRYQIDRARQIGMVDILPIGAITVGQKGEVLAQIAEMAAAGAVGISEDGMAVKNARIMKQAMEIAASLGIVVFAHCEDADLAVGGVMHEGETAKRLGLPGIPSASEDAIIARDIALAYATGAKLHICHVSTAGGAAFIADAKRRVSNITAEVAPHHFVLCDEDIDGTDGNFKMNPPLRGKNDVEAMRRALVGGDIDAIATDHAPHHADEKSGGFLEAANGIVGLETALPLAMTELSLSPMALINKMSTQPARILGINKGHLSIGAPADITIIDPTANYAINPESFASKSRNTPFGGRKVMGKVIYTIYGGKIVVKEGRLII